MKKNTKSPQPVNDDYIREAKNAVILDLGKKMNFSDVRSNQQVRLVGSGGLFQCEENNFASFSPSSDAQVIFICLGIKQGKSPAFWIEKFSKQKKNFFKSPNKWVLFKRHHMLSEGVTAILEAEHRLTQGQVVSSIHVGLKFLITVQLTQFTCLQLFT